MKYSIQMQDQICSIMATGRHTIASVCKVVSITRKTFHAWKRLKPAFAAALRQAEQNRFDLHRQRIRAQRQGQEATKEPVQHNGRKRTWRRSPIFRKSRS